ncbi:MAG: heme-binding protein [Pseudomonadota bacterium]
MIIPLAVLFVAVAVVLGWYFVTTNVETPDYKVAIRDGRIEVRDYPSLRMARIETKGQRWDGVRAGFRPLAGYIFAKERAGDKIAMTAPVTQEPSDQEGDKNWVISFIMPKAYALSDLPAPSNADVFLEEVPEKTRAAIRFSGVATDVVLQDKTRELERWLAAREITPQGPPIFAYYNDPFTPGFLRRNEVLFEVSTATN